MFSGKSELIIYQAEVGKSRIEVRLQGEPVWLSQGFTAEIFQKYARTLNVHIKNIYSEREHAALKPVTRKFWITALNREIKG